MKKFIKSNKGVSLVELIIGIAILAVIGFAVATFMKSGTMSYSSTSKEVNLQYEAQLVTNQINDILTEANGDVSYDSGNKTLSIVTSERQTAGGSSSTKVDLSYIAKCIRWYDADGAGVKKGDLWYYEWEVEKSVDVHTGIVSYTNKPGTETSHELLAQNVQAFDTDLTPDVAKGDDDDIITVLVTFSDGKKNFESTTNVSLRNAPTKNAAAISMPEPPGPSSSSTGSSSSTAPSIQKIVVSPSTYNMKPGASKSFEAKATGSGAFAQAFNWSVGGNTSPDTKITGNGTNTGTLVCGADETASKIYVYATHVDQKSKKGSAIVSIKVVEGVTVSKVSGSYAQNASLTLKASVTGKNISSNTEDQAVTWSIVEGASYISHVATNTFRISGSDEAVGKKVVIKATSAIDTSKSGTHEFVIVAAGNGGGGGDDPEEVKPRIKYNEWPEYIPRGGSGVFKPVLENAAGYSLIFEVEMTDGNGNVVKKGNGYTYNATGTQCTVNVLKSYDFEKEGYVKVSAYLKKGTTVYGPESKVAKVKPVSVKINTTEGTYKTTIDDVKLYYMQGSKKIYYEIQGIDPDCVVWESGKKSLLKVATSEPDINGHGTLTISAQNDKDFDSTEVTSQISSTVMTRFKVNVAPGNIQVHDQVPTPNVDYWSYLGDPYDEEVRDEWTPVKLTQAQVNEGKHAVGEAYYAPCPGMAGFYFYIMKVTAQYKAPVFNDYMVMVYSMPPSESGWDITANQPWWGTGNTWKFPYGPEQSVGYNIYAVYNKEKGYWYQP